MAADVGGEAGTLVARPPLAAVDSRRPAHRPQTPIATGQGQLPNPKRLQTAGGRRHRRRGKAPRPSEKGKLRQGGCVICHRYAGDSLQWSGGPAIRYPFPPQGVSDVDGVKTTRQMPVVAPLVSSLSGKILNVSGRADDAVHGRRPRQSIGPAEDAPTHVSVSLFSWPRLPCSCRFLCSVYVEKRKEHDDVCLLQ